MADNTYQAILTAQQRREAHIENSAKQARLLVRYETEGTGELIPPEPLRFVTPFFHQPAVISGFELVRRADRPYPPPKTWEEFAAEVDESYTVQDAHADYSSQYIYQLPRVTAGVYRWVRNRRGFYTGAFTYFSISVDFVDPDYVVTEQTLIARPVVIHNFTFMGESYKSMSRQVNEGASDESVRPFEAPKL